MNRQTSIILVPPPPQKKILLALNLKSKTFQYLYNHRQNNKF